MNDNLFKRIFLTILFVCIISFGFYNIKSLNLSTLIQYINSDQFTKPNISINGLKIIALKEIQNNIGTINNNLFHLDPWEIKEKIETIPLINDVQIIKTYPNLLTINVNEKQPMILAKDNYKLYIFDQHNKITTINREIIDRYQILKTLLYIEGDDILDDIPKLANLVINKTFSKRIIGIYKIGNRRWDMIVDHKIKVMLPEQIDQDFIDSVFITINRLKLNNDIDQQAIYSILDMRVKNKIFIKNI